MRDKNSWNLHKTGIHKAKVQTTNRLVTRNTRLHCICSYSHTVQQICAHHHHHHHHHQHHHHHHQSRNTLKNTDIVNLVDVVDAIRDVLEAVHEPIKAFFADPFKHLFAFLCSSSRSLKLIGRLYWPHLYIFQPGTESAKLNNRVSNRSAGLISSRFPGDILMKI